MFTAPGSTRATATLAVVVAAVAYTGFTWGPLVVAIEVGLVALLVTAAFFVGYRPAEGSTTTVTSTSNEPFPPLGMAVVLAAVVHVTAALYLNLSGIADSLVPDHMLYRRWGELLVLSLQDPLLELRYELGYNPTSLYYYFNAVAWFLVEEHTSVFLGVVNGFLHVAAAYVSAQIAHHLYGAAAARVCFWLMAFFPSLVVYSCVNLRDALSWLLIAVAIRGALLIRDRGRVLKETLPFALALIALAFVRSYVLVMLLVSLMAAQLVTSPRRLPHAIWVLIVVAGAGSLTATYAGIPLEMLSLDILEQVDRYRNALVAGGSATSFQDKGLSDPVNALLFLPKGIAFFLLSPFPWEVNNLRQAFALPELFVWYPILLIAATQALRETRRPHELATLLLPFIGIVSIYGLIEGNAGTANRHRGQIVLIVMVLASPIVARLLSRSERSNAT